MNIKKHLKALSLITLIVCLSGCTILEENPEANRGIMAMDTYMQFNAYGKNADEALEKAAKRVFDIENCVSVTIAGSDVSKLNRSQGTYIEVKNDTLFLVKKSFQINEMTNGAFNITLYPISKEWGFTTGEHKVPTQEKINDLLKNTGYDRILTDKEGMLSLMENTELDLGGIAKGYAGFEAARILKEEGITSAILNMGGNIQMIGAKPDGSYWKVGIRGPKVNTKLIGTIEVSDKAVVTSGAYERYFEENGNIYGHIMDPNTGYPSKSGVVSATVIGDDGTFCDALSTAIFVMGIDDAKSFLETHREIDAIILTDDKTLYVTKNILGSFTPSDEYENSDLIEI